ncbi:MAG: PepSY-associated TM helix domain-containing protein [Gemmatimonadaceae bacterium]
MRRTFILTHRWLAIVTSIFLLLTALSGASLVFEGAIDRALNQRLWHVEPAGQILPIDSIVSRVEATISGAKVGSINLSPERDQAWTVGAGKVTAFVNPYTGAINGTRTAAESQATLARKLHVFHVEFFSGKAGRTFVGMLSGVALFLVITGMILWWPDKLMRVNRSASWKRINFDLHHVFGICASLILIVITASGLVVHFDGLANAIKSLDSKPVPAPPAQVSASSATMRPSFDSIARVARTALPDANIMFISLGAGKNPASVAMRFPEDHTPAGRSRVFVDRNTYALLATSSTRAAEIGTRIDNLKRSLHTGDVFGRVTSALWLIATLVLAEQVLSGVLMWWNSRRARSRANAR